MSETGIDWPALLALEGQATAGKLVPEKQWAEYSGRAVQALPQLLSLVRGLAQAGARLRHPVIASTATQVQIAYEERLSDGAAWDALLATIPAALRAGVGDDA